MGNAAGRGYKSQTAPILLHLAINSPSKRQVRVSEQQAAVGTRWVCAAQPRSILLAAAPVVVTGWAPSPPHGAIPGTPLEIFRGEQLG